MQHKNSWDTYALLSNFADFELNIKQMKLIFYILKENTSKKMVQIIDTIKSKNKKIQTDFYKFLIISNKAQCTTKNIVNWR